MGRDIRWLRPRLRGRSYCSWPIRKPRIELDDEIVLTKAFQTPMAVPSNESSPTRTGIAAMNEMALVLSAKDDSRIGARGWTVVKPNRANTTM